MTEPITRAETDRIELEELFETARQTAGHRQELAVSSVKTAFLLNSGGLIALYTVIGHILDKSIWISRTMLASSGISLVLGLLFAGGAQLGYYLSWDRYTQAHFGAARNAMGRFRGEPDGINAHDLRTAARRTRSFARYLMLISVVLFGVGASVAVLAVVLALPQPATSVKASAKLALPGTPAPPRVKVP